MLSSSRDFKDDSYMSAKWLCVGLVLCAVVLVYRGDVYLRSAERLAVLRYAILLLGVAGVAWQWETRQPLAGRWFMLVATIGLLYLGVGWLGIAGLWLPVVTAYVLLTRQFVAGISAGAVKG